MTIPTSMGAHKLEIVKGSRDHIIDFTGILDSAASTFAAAFAGRVMSLNGSGNLVPGLTVGALPFFAWSGTDSNNAPDVQRDRGMPYSGQSRFGTVSVFAAVELSTTEFVDTTFAAGDILTAIATPATATTPADAGKLKKRTTTTDPIVGYVSPRGKATSPDGYSTLYFYPAYAAGSTVSVA